MRLNEVFQPLLERSTVSKETLSDYVKTYCKPYLAANPDHVSTPLFRGVKYGGNEAMVVPVDQNRPPKHSSVYIQDGFDEALKERGFKSLRGNSIFCTGDEDEAEGYGDVYRVYPIGAFTFTWSPEVKDLISYSNIIYRTFGLKDANGNPFTSLNRDANAAQAQEAGGIVGDFGKIVDSLDYRDTDLVAAIRSKNEITISCQKVLMVPLNMAKILEKV